MFKIYSREGIELLETKDRENALRCLHNWPHAAWITEIVTTHRIVALKDLEIPEVESLYAESEWKARQTQQER